MSLKELTGRAMTLLASLMSDKTWRTQLVATLAAMPAIAAAAGSEPSACVALSKPFAPESIASLMAGSPELKVRCHHSSQLTCINLQKVPK